MIRTCRSCTTHGTSLSGSATRLPSLVLAAAVGYGTHALLLRLLIRRSSRSVVDERIRQAISQPRESYYPDLSPTGTTSGPDPLRSTRRTTGNDGFL